MPNPWGLHDMHGNVMEWTADWHGEYSPAPSSDPKGPDRGSRRVVRGGSWNYIAGYCRSSNRYWFAPSVRFDALGFRLAMSPE